MKLHYIALLGVLVGCSGANTDPLTTPNVNSTTIDASSQCSHNVTRRNPNGWLLTQPEVHMDFWGNWSQWKDDTDVVQPVAFETAWLNLLTQNNVLQRLAEYGIYEGSFDIVPYFNTGSTTNFNADAGAGWTMLDDSTFDGVLQSEIQENLLPYPNDNTLYVVMLPPNVTTHSMNINGWSGYHEHSSYAGQRFAYAIIQYSNSNVTISHELYEAATDPDVGGGYYDQSGSEIGDLCEGGRENIYGNVVQKVWSQALCQCQ